MPGTTRCTGYASGMLALASRSPRRSELLAQLRIPFSVLDVQVPELRAADETPAGYVLRVAGDKARAGLAQCPQPGAWVLGADTEVVLDDAVFGKPSDAGDAARMLRQLSGRTHTVLSAVWLVNADTALHALHASQVRVATLDDATIRWYLASGDWQGKAGAYAIQGMAQAFIAHLSGSQSGVMGLPLHETAGLLARAGLLPLQATVGAGEAVAG